MDFSFFVMVIPATLFLSSAVFLIVYFPVVPSHNPKELLFLMYLFIYISF